MYGTVITYLFTQYNLLNKYIQCQSDLSWQKDYVQHFTFDLAQTWT